MEEFCGNKKCRLYDTRYGLNCRDIAFYEGCKVYEPLTAKEDAVADVQPAMTGVDCLDGVEVVAIEKYRGGFTGLSNDYNKARVTISLKFPEHLNLYYKLKGMAD